MGKFVAEFWREAGGALSAFWRQEADEDTRRAMLMASIEQIPEELLSVAAASFCPEISEAGVTQLCSAPDKLMELFSAYATSSVPQAADAIPAVSDEAIWGDLDPVQRQRARQLMVVSRRSVLVSLLSGVALIFTEPALSGDAE